MKLFSLILCFYFFSLASYGIAQGGDKKSGYIYDTFSGFTDQTCIAKGYGDNGENILLRGRQVINSVCGSARQGEWEDFEKAARSCFGMDIALSKVKCGLAMNTSGEHFDSVLHVNAAYSDRINSFFRKTLMYVYKNKKVEVLEGLLEGNDGENNLFVEIKNAYHRVDIESRKEQLKSVGNFTCKIVSKIGLGNKNIKDIYDENCSGTVFTSLHR